METSLSVTQISNYFKQIFEAEEMLYNVKVVGEISGLSIARGVAYFTLKDDNAQMSCVCFDIPSIEFKNGDKICVTGTPRYYVKGGKLNFNVNKIEPVGLGELYQQFLKLKEKLDKLGYFDEDIKKSIPTNIKRIGVVTSQTGAVIQDIINVRNRRNPSIDIVLYPAKVQGEGADKEIARGIYELDNYNVDVIIVARGGGSLEDLMPFNSELVANAIYNATKPIVSAVGHETDFTICDFCSDLRAPTPSAASEILCDLLSNKYQYILNLKDKLISGYSDYINDMKTSCKNLYLSFESCAEKLTLNTHNDMKSKIIKFINVSKSFVEDKVYENSIVSTKLNKLNPEEVLKLGYAIVKTDKQGVNSILDVNVNDRIDITLKDGKMIANVLSVNKGEL